MNNDDLKEKPIWQMTGEEFLYLQQNTGATTATTPTPAIDGTTKKLYLEMGQTVHLDRRHLRRLRAIAPHFF